MPTYPVQVSGIAPSTTNSQLHDFFTFCGTINTIEHDENSSTATVKFDKVSAAKTALMLNGGNLDGATLTVKSDVVHEDELPSATDTAVNGIEQSDKPRAAIAAEYLAKGYTLSEQILERAIEIDRKQGISNKFLQYFRQLDESLGARTFGPEQKVSTQIQAKVDEQIQHAKAIDEQRGFSKIAHDYYQRAISSPLGQRVLQFYTDTSKQVHDIREEARRIAQEERRKSHGADEGAAEKSAEATKTTEPAASTS